MSELAAYEREPYRTRLEVTVLQAGEDKGVPYVLLDDTILYPEGGGQPSDRGTLGAVPVLEVRRRGPELRHLLAAPVAPGPAALVLDWERRFDHMQQHTGQHLLTAVAQDRFGWKTTAFHLGEAVSDIELDVPALSSGDLSALEEAVAAEIRAARPVTARRVAPRELPALKVRSRGLPEGFQGDVRLVEIAGVDLNTCGGTHLASTAELESLKLLGTEPLRGGTRVHYVAGGRVRRRLGEAEIRQALLRGLLGAPDEGLAGAVEGKLEQLRALERRVRGLEDDLASNLVASLAARPGDFLEQHFEGRDAGFLQKASRALTAASPSKAAFLTAALEGQAWFLLCAGEASPLDVPALGREVALRLGGKGGGSGRLFQGKAASLSNREAALAWLQAQAGGGQGR